MSDPVSKTEFQKSLARRLSEFQEPLERDNYIEAVAARYNIARDDLRALVASVAAEGAVTKAYEKPKSGITAKKTPEDGMRKNQRLLLTWLSDEPGIFPSVKKWIGPEDFADDLYRSVAKELFEELESGSFNPSRILGSFTDEEELRQIAEMFNTNFTQIETPEQRRKAFRDIIIAVRQAGYERLKKELRPDDPDYLMKVVQGKKDLEKLIHADINPDE